jgi:hypothetical protein
MVRKEVWADSDVHLHFLLMEDLVIIPTSMLKVIVSILDQ